jgi:hypothetical protein
VSRGPADATARPPLVSVPVASPDCRLTGRNSKDFRVTDTQHSVVHLADGTSFPIQIRTTLLFHPDGTFEVKVDSLGCGGPST